MEYNRQEAIEAKETLGKNGMISKIWHDEFAPSTVIGNCTNLFREILPVSDGDFYNRYFEYAEQHHEQPISQRGLTRTEFEEMARRYMLRGNSIEGVEYPYETYYNDAVCHIITETYDGKIKELEFYNFLEGLGYKCGWFEGTVDGKYGVDIKVTNKEGKVSGIQIKPISFFTSKRADVHADRVNSVAKYYNFLNDFGCKTYYAVYVKDRETKKVKWLKNGNGYRFKINELYTYDIKDVRNSLRVRKLPEKMENLPV